MHLPADYRQHRYRRMAYHANAGRPENGRFQERSMLCADHEEICTAFCRHLQDFLSGMPPAHDRADGTIRLYRGWNPVA